MEHFKNYLVIVLFIVFLVALFIWWNPFSWHIWSDKTTQQTEKTTCTHNWKCDWGPCVNGNQSQIAVDSNNCGMALTGQIACPTLTRACSTEK